MMDYQIIFILLLPLAHSANVLVIGGFQGSHLYLATEVAEKLVGFGHNVTVLTSYESRRVNMRNRSFHYKVFADEISHLMSEQEILQIVRDNIEDILILPSKDMLVDLLTGSEKAKRTIELFNSVTAVYFKGKGFANLVKDTKFDLIVVEDSTSISASFGLVNLDIPVMGIYSASELKPTRDKYALPGLINSEPNTINEIFGDSPPTFVQRWETIVRTGRLYMWTILHILEIFKEESTRTGKNIDHLLDDYIMAQYDVAFVLDHPAFSFPYQRPPNTFYLGPFHLEGRTVNPLPEIYQEFLSNCPHQHLALMSFGSYIRNITVFPKTVDIVKTIGDMKLCVIIKTDVDIVDVVSLYNLPPNQILQQAWLPQKDLLGSGKIDFFISHCGNNGRLESIYYGVPLFCIPLFADQYHNARLVDRNKFGVYVTKEDLSEDTFRGAVATVLGNKELFVANMRNAVEVARGDPGAGTNVLKFYTELLIKNGNADFLINKIILKQSFNEIVNLDIAMLALMVLLGLAVGGMLCTCNILKLCCRKLAKPKTD